MAKKKIIAKKPVPVKKQPVKKTQAPKSAQKTKQTARKPEKPAPKKRSVARVKSPTRQIKKVNTELKKTRSPLYNLNRKIKNAPNRYWKGKYNKQKRELLAKIQPAINILIDERSDLKKKKKEFKAYQADKRILDNKLASIRRKKKAIKSHRKKSKEDIEELRKLNHQEAKYLLEKDNLDEDNGAELDRSELEEYDREDWADDGGSGFELDARSPYHIYDADRKLNEDINSGEFNLFIINGQSFNLDNADGALLQASEFWISEKKGRDGTPLINRYFNLKKKAVKYLSANF